MNCEIMIDMFRNSLLAQVCRLCTNWCSACMTTNSLNFVTCQVSWLQFLIFSFLCISSISGFLSFKRKHTWSENSFRVFFFDCDFPFVTYWTHVSSCSLPLLVTVGSKPSTCVQVQGRANHCGRCHMNSSALFNGFLRRLVEDLSSSAHHQWLHYNCRRIFFFL